MVAPLVANDKIPEVAKKVSPAGFKVLRRLKAKGGSLLNANDVDVPTAEILMQLTNELLVDVGFAEQPAGRPYVWTLTGNGERVLQHLEAELPQLIAEEQEREDAERVKDAKWTQ
jgi:hypothetical protein